MVVNKLYSDTRSKKKSYARRLISDAQIKILQKGQINHITVEHQGPKIPKVFQNTAKIMYSWGRKS